MAIPRSAQRWSSALRCERHPPCLVISCAFPWLPWRAAIFLSRRAGRPAFNIPHYYVVTAIRFFVRCDPLSVVRGSASVRRRPHASEPSDRARPLRGRTGHELHVAPGENDPGAGLHHVHRRFGFPGLVDHKRGQSHPLATLARHREAGKGPQRHRPALHQRRQQQEGSAVQIRLRPRNHRENYRNGGQ